MNSKTSAEKPVGSGTKAGVMRRPEQGNMLWRLYHKLTRWDQRELKEEIERQGFWWTTFLHDTKHGRALNVIPFWRLDMYRSFFQLRGLPDLFELARQERAAIAHAPAA